MIIAGVPKHCKDGIMAAARRREYADLLQELELEILQILNEKS